MEIKIKLSTDKAGVGRYLKTMPYLLPSKLVDDYTEYVENEFIKTVTTAIKDRHADALVTFCIGAPDGEIVKRAGEVVMNLSGVTGGWDKMQAVSNILKSTATTNYALDFETWRKEKASPLPYGLARHFEAQREYEMGESMGIYLSATEKTSRWFSIGTIYEDGVERDIRLKSTIVMIFDECVDINMSEVVNPLQFREELEIAKPDIFVSHKGDNMLLAEEIAREVSKKGLVVYLDRWDHRKNGDGPELVSHLKQILEVCEGELVVLTEDACHSWWVPYEIAIAESEKKIISIFVAGQSILSHLPSCFWKLGILGDMVDVRRWSQIFEETEGKLAKFYAGLEEVCSYFFDEESFVWINYQPGGAPSASESGEQSQ